MATAAMVKQVQVRQTKPKLVEASLEGVYEALVKILQRHAPPFRTEVHERRENLVPVDGPEACGDSRRLRRQAR